jgi:hypothetical protein
VAAPALEVSVNPAMPPPAPAAAPQVPSQWRAESAVFVRPQPIQEIRTSKKCTLARQGLSAYCEKADQPSFCTKSFRLDLFQESARDRASAQWVDKTTVFRTLARARFSLLKPALSGSKYSFRKTKFDLCEACRFGPIMFSVRYS